MTWDLQRHVKVLFLLLTLTSLYVRPSWAVRRLDVASEVLMAEGGRGTAMMFGNNDVTTFQELEGDLDGNIDEEEEDDEEEEEAGDSNPSQHQRRKRRRRRLLGKPVDVPIPTSADDHLVTDLPLLNNADLGGAKHWAGLLPASGDKDKYLFYWLFAPDPVEAAKKSNDDSIPLLIWLNGGPACSSMDGLWLENGPLRLTRDANDDWTIKIDPHSWHTSPAYVVYIDQPVGTGIAFTTSGKYPSNDEKVNIDFYYFLKEFMKLHQDKFLSAAADGDGRRTLRRPFYFSGESHAGHYIPSMMNYIRKQNEGGTTDIIMPLSGAAIGNGWIDPIYQYSAHDAAYGYGLIGTAQRRSLEQDEERCRADLRQGNYVNSVCFGLLDAVVSNSQGQGSKYEVSQYDQRNWEIKGKPRDFPPGHKDVEAYLGGHGSGIANANYKDVLKALHSTPSLEAGQRYYECTDPPYNALKHQDGLGVVPDVVDLLNANVRMLFFNGIHDLICNHVGNENAIENFPWQSKGAYQQSERYGWVSPSTGQLGGYMKEYQNLMFLKVLDSGHMVPMDVPDVSLDMMRTFMYEGSFQSYQQNIKSSLDDGKSCPVCPACDNNNNDDESDFDGNDNDDDTDCPICDDCGLICKTQKSNNKDETVTDEFDANSTSRGAGWGILAFVSLTGATLMCWYYVRRGRNNNHSWTGRSRVASRSPPTSPRRRVHEYDMELSKASMSLSTTNNGNGNSNGGIGGFHDDDTGYSDDAVASNGRSLD